MTSSATAPPLEVSLPPGSPITNKLISKQIPRSRVLTPVVVCGSPCVLPHAREGQLLSPLLTAAAATAAANSRGTNGNVLLQNNVPASESEKLTATNIYVLNELEQPRPRPSDIESTFCPASVEPFRKAWWAGVRPTTCERTCRHRSKVCDAIQLCNDCTGYYCKWLAELVGIPVLKASGRVDPLLFEKDPLAKLYWERISKVACCPKVTAKCLMCIRRYQLFTHFLPGNLDFRSLVHESVMKLHEEGFAVDMGLIRKVTRRHLECITDNMDLHLPTEYMSSFHAYDIIVRRGPLVDVLANGLSCALQSQGFPQNYSSPASDSASPRQHSVNSPNVQHFPVIVSPTHKSKDQDPRKYSFATNQSPDINDTEQDVKLSPFLRETQTLSTSDSIAGSPREPPCLKLDSGDMKYGSSSPTQQPKKKARRTSSTVLASEVGEANKEDGTNNKRRSRRQVKKPVYNGQEDIYYGDDTEFLSLLDDGEPPEDQDSDDTDDGERGRKKRRRASIRRSTSKDLSFPGFGFEHQLSGGSKDSSSGFDALAHQFKSGIPPEVSIDTETFQMLCRSKGGRGSRQATREGMWVPNSALKGSRILRTSTTPQRVSNEEQLDTGDGSSEPLDRLAAAFLQRLDSGRSKSSKSSMGVTEVSHQQQLTEEIRLAQAGVQGVFWDPSKEGWCVLLPLLPSMAEDGLGSIKRKILCFAASTWKSFDSAKWSAVYERLRRNPRELEALSQNVRQDLSLWVRENIEAAPDCPPSLQTNSVNNNNREEVDNPAASGRLVDLLGSLAKHISSLDLRPNEEEQLSYSQNETNEITDTEEQDNNKLPSSILALLASLQSRLPTPRSEYQGQKSEIKPEGH